MRLSRYFLPILRETPKEAEIVSHRLMLRAGMIRQEAAGIYAWLPLGLRVLNKVNAIVREEQNRSGAVELADADDPVRRPVAGIGPLRRLWQGDAAHPGPARARHAVRADQRGDDHRDLPRLCALLQGSAAEPLPHPVEVPRRGAPALRRHALARVPDEGRLFLRSRPGRRAPFLQQDVRGLSAHLRPHGPEGDPDARRYRPDRRRTSATSSSSWPRPARARCSATRIISISTFPRSDTDFDDMPRRCRALVDKWTSLYAATSEMHDAAAFEAVPADKKMSARGIEVGHIFYFGTKYSAPMGAKVMGPDGQEHDGPYGLLRHRPEPPDRRHHRGEPRRERHHLAGGGRAVRCGDPQPEGRRCRHRCGLRASSIANSAAAGRDVLYDDRDERPGGKFATADLIGIPWQVLIGPKGLADGKVELKRRATGERELLSLERRRRPPDQPSIGAHGQDSGSQDGTFRDETLLALRVDARRALPAHAPAGRLRLGHRRLLVPRHHARASRR